MILGVKFMIHRIQPSTPILNHPQADRMNTGWTPAAFEECGDAQADRPPGSRTDVSALLARLKSQKVQHSLPHPSPRFGIAETLLRLADHIEG